MNTHRLQLRRNSDTNPFSAQTFFLCLGLLICFTTVMSAVESIPPSLVDQLPQTIRTKLVQVSGGATITDVTIDRSFGDPRYIAHYRDPESNEVHTVTLGQTGNVIDSGAIPVSEPDTAIGGRSTEKPEKVKPVKMDGPAPLSPPQRPIPPVAIDTPAVATTSKEQPPKPVKKPVPEVPIPRLWPSVTPEIKTTPTDIPQKEEDRDGTAPLEESKKKPNISAPHQNKSSDQKSP